MEILTKKLKKGEINWGGLVIPRSKKTLFPPPGVEFDLLDNSMTFTARMDDQSRLRISAWYKQHRAVKPGDEVTLYKENGKMRISLSRYFSKPEKEIFNWAQEVIEAIRGGEIEGIIRLNKDGFCVEIGDHVKKTEIISTTR